MKLKGVGREEMSNKGNDPFAPKQAPSGLLKSMVKKVLICGCETSQGEIIKKCRNCAKVEESKK